MRPKKIQVILCSSSYSGNVRKIYILVDFSYYKQKSVENWCPKSNGNLRDFCILMLINSKYATFEKKSHWIIKIWSYRKLLISISTMSYQFENMMPVSEIPWPVPWHTYVCCVHTCPLSWDLRRERDQCEHSIDQEGYSRRQLFMIKWPCQAHKNFACTSLERIQESQLVYT